MKLHNPIIPYSFDKNLMDEYNFEMSRIEKDEDWAIFIDHDAIFTTYDWKHIILNYIKDYSQYSCLVGVTNRIGGDVQRLDFAPKSDNYIEHRDFGKILASNNLDLLDFTKPFPHHLSGVCFALKKSAWKQIGGFKQWSDKSKILGIDSQLHKDLYENGLKTGVMPSLYVYHYYRGGTNNKEHLS